MTFSTHVNSIVLVKNLDKLYWLYVMCAVVKSFYIEESEIKFEDLIYFDLVCLKYWEISHASICVNV